MNELVYHSIDKNEFFRELSSANKERLAGICVPKKIAKKQLLFCEGDDGAAVYLCATGSLKLYKSMDSGETVVIRLVLPGDLFGEVVLMNKRRYPVSAMTMEPCLLYVLYRQQFLSLLDNSDFNRNFTGLLMGKMSYLSDRIRYLTRYDVEERVYNFLRERSAGKNELSLPMKKKDIASAVGTTPETLSRLITRLSADGLLLWKEKKVTVDWGRWRVA